ncbi:hypothetical protein VP01_394g1 [Puccinia sorghi]|uniref:Uncharacterized protein n=1 Tax=Puccinia sorghi TaxID=27349 RepID=A0A0L6USD4_9BASI|nr:hypothetical protein VP01_394g1 [Puccinia sorghi]
MRCGKGSCGKGSCGKGSCGKGSCGKGWSRNQGGSNLFRKNKKKHKIPLEGAHLMGLKCHQEECLYRLNTSWWNCGQPKNILNKNNEEFLPVTEGVTWRKEQVKETSKFFNSKRYIFQILSVILYFLIAIFFFFEKKIDSNDPILTWVLLCYNYQIHIEGHNFSINCDSSFNIESIFIPMLLEVDPSCFHKNTPITSRTLPILFNRFGRISTLFLPYLSTLHICIFNCCLRHFMFLFLLFLNFCLMLKYNPSIATSTLRSSAFFFPSPMEHTSTTKSEPKYIAIILLDSNLSNSVVVLFFNIKFQKKILRTQQKISVSQDSERFRFRRPLCTQSLSHTIPEIPTRTKFKYFTHQKSREGTWQTEPENPNSLKNFYLTLWSSHLTLIFNPLSYHSVLKLNLADQDCPFPLSHRKNTLCFGVFPDHIKVLSYFSIFFLPIAFDYPSTSILSCLVLFTA